MIAIKNTAKTRLTPSFDGVIYEFSPNEVKVLPPKVASHLISSTYSCGIGASPLKVVQQKDLSKELEQKESAAVAPTLLLLVNDTELSMDLMHDGEIYTVPAEGSLALPQAVATAIHERFIGAKRAGLLLKKVEKKPADATPPAPPADTSGSASAPAPHSDGGEPPKEPQAPAAPAAKPEAKSSKKDKNK